MVKKSTAVLAAFLVVAAFLIWWRYGQVEQEIEKEAEAITAYAGQEVEFTAKVVKAPEQRFSSQHVVVEPDFAPAGRILLGSSKDLSVLYADRVTVQGKLETPGVFEGFNYAEFLAKDRIYAIINDPRVTLAEREAYGHFGERVMAGVFSLKKKFRETLEQHLAPRHSSVMVEMLLGDRAVMSKELAEDLDATGLRHIIAISGAHIAILTMYLMPFLIWLGLWRHQAFYLTMALVIFYVVLTGLQPSAIRSGIMGSMFLLGQHLGRPYAALRALVLSAAVMILVNPLLLTRDVGFQLSFLAVFGMIVLLPTIRSLLPQTMPGRQLLAMTIAAQVFTLPILTWSFGQVSVITIVSNLLVVPMVPLLMGFGFVLMIGGTVVPVLGFLVSFPVGFLVQYILLVVDLFSSLPFAVLQTQDLSAFWLALFYATVAVIYWKFRKRGNFLVQ